MSSIPDSIITNPNEFLCWCTLWHGDHARGHEHHPCSVYKTLQKHNNGKASLHDLFNAVIETDDDWQESWDNYLYEKNI